MIGFCFLISCSKKEGQDISSKNLSPEEFSKLVKETILRNDLEDPNFKTVEVYALSDLVICDPSSDPNFPSQGCQTYFETRTFNIPPLHSCPGCNAAVFSYRYKICLLPNNSIQIIVYDVRFEETQSNCSQAFWDCYSNLNPNEYLMWIEQMKQIVAFEVEKSQAQSLISLIPYCNSGPPSVSAKYQSSKCWRVCVPPVPIPLEPYVMENCGHMCCAETRTVCRNSVTGDLEWSTPSYNLTNISACGWNTPICGNNSPCYFVSCGEVMEIQ